MNTQLDERQELLRKIAESFVDPLLLLRVKPDMVFAQWHSSFIFLTGRSLVCLITALRTAHRGRCHVVIVMGLIFSRRSGSTNQLIGLRTLIFFVRSIVPLSLNAPSGTSTTCALTS